MFFWNGAKFIIALVKPRLISSNRSSMEWARQHHRDRSSSVYSSACRCIQSGGCTLLECTHSFSRPVASRAKLSVEGVTGSIALHGEPVFFSLLASLQELMTEAADTQAVCTNSPFLSHTQRYVKMKLGSTDLSSQWSNDAVSSPLPLMVRSSFVTRGGLFRTTVLTWLIFVFITSPPKKIISLSYIFFTN